MQQSRIYLELEIQKLISIVILDLKANIDLLDTVKPSEIEIIARRTKNTSINYLNSIKGKFVEAMEILAEMAKDELDALS